VVGAGVTFVVGAVQYLVMPDPRLAPFVLLYAAVAITAWLAGPGPGLMAVVIAGALGNFFFISGHGAFDFGAAAVPTLLFVLSAGVAAWLAGSLRASFLAADRQARLLRMSGEATFTWWPDAGIASWNAGAHALYGFTEAEALGRPPQALLSSVLPCSLEGLLATLRVQGSWQGELRQRTKDGRAVIALTRLQLFEDDDGRELVLEASRDVTERKRRALELEALFEGNRTPMAYLDRRFVYVRVNVAAAEALGVTKDELIGKDHFALYPSHHFRRILERVRDTRAPFVALGERIRIAGRPERGATYWNWSVAPIEDEAGAVAGVLVSAVDVTEQAGARRRVEQLQRVTAACSAALTPGEVAQAVFDGALSEVGCSMVNICSFVDPRHLVFTYAHGLPDHDIASHSPLPLDGPLPASVVARTGEPVWVESGVELEARYPDLAPLRASTRIEAFASLPLIAGGRMLGVLGFAFDRVHRFDAEERAHFGALASQCAQALARAEAFEQLRDELVRKDEFVAALSHELRNPLAPIRSGLYVIEHAPAGSEAAHRALAIVSRQTAHLTRLVDDLLDLTRLTHGRIELKREAIELGALVTHVVEDHSALFASSRVRLEVHLEPQPLWIDGDPARLAQALGNLLHNAAKFTPPGRGVVLTTEPGVEGGAVVRVRDEGVGIDPHLLPRVFEPFTQADKTLDRSKGGLGLGLPLARSLIELHQGRLLLRSDGVDRGTECIVELPPGRLVALPGGEQARSAGVD
jgi:PAS domain S-box-containing protein